MNKGINNIDLSQIRYLFRTQLNDLFLLACRSSDSDAFKADLLKYLESEKIRNINVKNHIKELIFNDGNIIFELSTEKNIKVESITLLWRFLINDIDSISVSFDFLIDLYHQFLGLYDSNIHNTPNSTDVLKWMRRWPSGLNQKVIELRKGNKERIIQVLIKKIEAHHSLNSKYVFPVDISTLAKRKLVEEWWGDYNFQLIMAIKSASDLDKMLDGKLSEETREIYRIAKDKEIPIFITPYYLSLLNTNEDGYNDESIRSYVIYSRELVETYGNIRAWEKEDVVEEGRPNAAGWLLPDGHNVHRRYPEVAILIPETIGRACGGLCASCQRMYDFQSKRFNFNFDDLKPKETWNTKLKRLMSYFEYDTQIRDILITGGDALMSQNSTIHHILEAIYDMAFKKRLDNLLRVDGEKFAEIQRIRLGTRLPVYLPMRINNELINILQSFKKKASQIGIKQFIIQTHFQSPLEITPESKIAIEKILSSGWIITNQLVYNVAVSRRGHTAKLRKVLNDLGVVCYYTFSVKGFNENYAAFTPNSRSMQESKEEKVIGSIANEFDSSLQHLIESSHDKQDNLKDFCKTNGLPFVATDRNVLNIPGIGKSMTFKTIGIDTDGKRILQFDHDKTRKHSPIIDKMGKVYIKENKSLYRYLLQLDSLNENIKEYESLWNYCEGETEERFSLFNYPDFDFRITDTYSNLEI